MTTAPVRISQCHLRQLSMRASTGPVVSFYLSPERGSIGHEATVQRLHALVRQAKRQLGSAPWRFTEAEADRFIERVGTDMVDVERGPDEGLVWFVTGDGVEQFLIGGFVADRVTVAPTIDPLPATAVLNDDVSFHLLELSQHHVRLYHCDSIGWRRLPGAQMPESRDDALWAVEEKDDHKPATARFVRSVARELPEQVRAGSIPLVVAAVEYEAAMFRDVSHHPDLELVSAFGSPEHVPIARLHAHAVEILRGRTHEATAFLLERYRALAGTGKTVLGMEPTLTAAEEGRVDTLMIPRFRWQPAELESVQLVAVAVATLAHGGAIAVIDEGDDEISPVGALLRY